MDVVREVGLTATFSSSLMAFETRTSKLLRKVGQFRSIFTKKPTDGPYMAMTPKPFMSQPMLPMEMVESDGSSSDGDNVVGRHSMSMARLTAGPSRSKLVKPAPAASRSSLRLTTSEEPVRPTGLPMPLNRFSFILNEDKGSARLSPSIITRQPMPILNLPTLPVPAPTPGPGPSERRQSQLRLRHMPTLGLSPGDQPEDNQNDEDLEDIVDDAEETDEEAEEVFVDPPEDPTEGEYDESGMPRSSTSSETRPPSRASYTSPYQARFGLPLIDTSSLDLSFLNKSPSPTTRRIFDKGKAKAGDPGVTPTAKRPTRYQNNTDYFSFSSQEGDTPYTDPTTTDDTAQVPDSSMETPRPGDAFRLPSFLAPPAHDVPTRPSMYKHASKSLVNFHSRPSLDEVKLTQRNTNSIFTIKSKQSHPDTESSNSRIVNLNEDDDNVPLGVVRAAAAGTTSTTTTTTSTINPAQEQQHSSLRRRGSMPTFSPTTLPPPYPDFLSPHQSKSQAAASSATMCAEECEGKERLPVYSNSIYLRAMMPRKMEFAAPGVQSKDRKWRRVLCELEGTVFRVYKCPSAGTLGEWWENKIGVGDVSVVGNGSATYNPSAAGRQTESVLKLVDERVEGDGQTELRIPQPPPSSSSTFLTPPAPPPEMNESPSRSRFPSFLKPRTHSRSRSDVPNAMPKTPHTPRSSFSIPRPSFGSSSSGSGSSNSNLLAGSSSSPAMTSPSQSNSSLTVSIPPLMQGVDSGRTPRTSSSHNTLVTSAQEVPLGSASSLVKAYTLQHSESGLANDYLKRKNVIRVRMEGQQFLLQARDVGAVVEWIEGFQAASNVALDLDERSMPKGPMFPRRRRRRQRRAENGDETRT